MNILRFRYQGLGSLSYGVMENEMEKTMEATV